jgi:hypothetical protein
VFYFDTDEPGKPVRICTVSGAPEKVATAVQRIDEIINEVSSCYRCYDVVADPDRARCKRVCNATWWPPLRHSLSIVVYVVVTLFLQSVGMVS